jgi:hypothetical protein
MAKKLSFTQELVRTPKQRSRYFWVRRVFSMIVALGIAGWLRHHVGDVFAIIIGITVFFPLYIYISHYVALIICAMEEIASGRM